MYDPLIESYPKPWQPYPKSYWSSTCAEKSTGYALEQDKEVDVAIVGAGYAGLSAAIQLARKSSLRIAVLEANQSGWGCSGRNGGFVLPGTGRLSIQQWAKKFGFQTATKIYREYRDAIDTVNRLIALGNIDCDQTAGGYVKLAHRADQQDALKQHGQYLREHCGENIHYFDRQRVKDKLLHCDNIHGGLYYPDVYGVNPLKLAQGYAELAESLGVSLHTDSPVVDWQERPQGHALQTPNGRVNADKVIIATNGYTTNALHPSLVNRHFPVISSIIVTRPLSQEELASIQMQPGLMAMDTRSLKYYYRLLPDGRLLFGGRGAIKGKQAGHQVYSQRLMEGLVSTFPQLKQVTLAYFWSGWVSVAFDDYPRIWQSEDQSVHYAMGYCGAGLSFATQAGKRMAENVLGTPSLSELPFSQSPLPKFPLAKLRRLGLQGFYALAGWRDR